MFKIITKKEYNKLKDIEEKYNLLIGQTITFWSGGRSKVARLLELDKEELVKRYMDLNNIACQLQRKLERNKNNANDRTN